MNIYDSVINNESLRVMLIIPPESGKSPDEKSAKNDSVIYGYLENPFEVNTSLEWSDKLFGRDYATNLNKLVGQLGGDIQVLNILDTMQTPIATRIPEFKLEFYVIATKKDDNPMKKVLRLYESTFPERVSVGTVKYHWGFVPNALAESGGSSLTQQPTKGTVIVTIGKWFRAINMILKNPVLTYSDTVGTNGKPLWVKVSVIVMPRRLPYADEFASMFLVD